MDTEDKESFILRVEKGKTKGKVFHFSQREVSIGRSDPCDLILDDDSVSRQHATITFDGENYVIKDSSTNGTFVNGNRIRMSQKLIDGDVIGIGPYNLMRYEQGAEVVEFVEEGRAKSRGRPKAISDVITQVKSLLRQKPLLAAGLGIYFAFILFLFLYFAFSPSDREKVTAEQADRLVKETEQFLTRFSLPDKGAGATTNFALAVQILSEGKSLEAIEGEDPGGTYLVLTKYRQALSFCGFPSLSEYQRVKKEKGTDAGVPEQVAQALEEALKRILTRIHELVFLGWVAEGHDRRDEAIRIYERVLAIVPDEGAPSYRFALDRIRDLKR